MKRTMIVALGCVAVLLAPASALAGRDESVDPATMQPALNPTFAPWECWRAGPGITCVGHRNLAWTNAAWGIDCEAGSIFGTGTDERTLTRYGDAQGRALSSRQHVEIKEVISVQPDGSGPTLNGVGLFQEHYEYLVPGDLSSRTDTYTGLDVRVTGPGVGLVALDTGVKTFDIDDNVLFIHGRHDAVEDFDGMLQQICDAFLELGA